MSDPPTKVRTVPAVLAPFQSLFRDVQILLAVPLAVLRSRCSFRGQGLLGAAVLVPLVLPPLVGALSRKRLRTSSIRIG